MSNSLRAVSHGGGLVARALRAARFVMGATYSMYVCYAAATLVHPLPTPTPVTCTADLTQGAQGPLPRCQRRGIGPLRVRLRRAETGRKVSFVVIAEVELVVARGARAVHVLTERARSSARARRRPSSARAAPATSQRRRRRRSRPGGKSRPSSSPCSGHLAPSARASAAALPAAATSPSRCRSSRRTTTASHARTATVSSTRTWRSGTSRGARMSRRGHER